MIQSETVAEVGRKMSAQECDWLDAELIDRRYQAGTLLELSNCTRSGELCSRTSPGLEKSPPSPPSLSPLVKHFLSRPETVDRSRKAHINGHQNHRLDNFFLADPDV